MKSLDRRDFLTYATSATAALSLAASAARAGAADKEKIKIGQIGTGHAHASGVFSQLKQGTAEYELVGIVENDPQRRKALSSPRRDKM